MKIQYQSPNCIVFESALYRTTSCIVHTNDLVLLVDPNYFPLEIDFIRQKLDEIRKSKPVYLLFTHSDFDHIVGMGAFKNVKVITSEAFIKNPDKQSGILKIKELDDDFYVLRDYELRYPDPDITIHQNHQVFEPGPTKIQFYQAPGHNRNSLFAVFKSLGIWICGDYLSNIEFPFIYHSYKEYLDTLDTCDEILSTHKIKLVIPGHGDICQNREEIKKRIDDSRSYILSLIESIRNDKQFDLNDLWKRYDFPISMKTYHLENIELITKEWSNLEKDS